CQYAGATSYDGFVESPVFEIACQRVRRAVSPRWLFLQALEADRLQVAVHGWIEHRRTARLPFQNLANGFQRRPASKGWEAGQRLVEHRAKPVSVRRSGHFLRLSPRLFR